MNIIKKKIMFPLKIKGSLSNTSILSKQYIDQKNKAPFLRMYLDNLYHSDMGWHGDINYFNLLSLNVLMSETENDIRANDIFIHKETKKEVRVSSITNKEVFYIPEGLKEKFSIPVNRLIEEYVWAPVYFACQNDNLAVFYHTLYNLYVCELNDLERSDAISFLKSILVREGIKNAVRWLNIGDEHFKSVLSDNEII